MKLHRIASSASLLCKFAVALAPLLASAPALFADTPPTISTVANQTITMNGATATLNVTVGDADTPASSLVLTTWGSNPVLTPPGSIVLGGSGGARTIKVTPAANQSGSNETITLTVTDGAGLSASSSFNFTVTNVTNANTAPLISSIPDQVIAQNADTGALAFIVSDRQSAPPTLTVTSSSSNPVLVFTGGIALAGTGSGRTVKVTPASNQTGTANITLTVSDGALSSSTTFAVNVTAANTRPTISAVANQIVTAGSAPTLVNFTIGDTETPAVALTLGVKSSNGALLPASSLVPGGAGANRTLTLAPVSGQTGAATITLTVSDGSMSTSTHFIFAVHDPALPANAYARPTGIFALDSLAGTSYTRADGVTISLRDAGIRNTGYVDGYVLRVAWDSIEMAQGSYDFKIIDNIVSKLPAGQKLSLIITPQDPSYIAATNGVTTWVDTSVSPSVTRAVPWDPFLRVRRGNFLQALASHVIAGGGTFANWPQLCAINPYLAGGFTGIRDPVAVFLRNMSGYSRAAFLGAVQDELRALTTQFATKFVQIGFWNVTDNENANYGGLAAWQYIRQELLAEFDGAQRPRVGFFQENLAAGRQSWGADPVDGRPLTAGIAQPVYESQSQTWSAFQALGSWIAPFNFAHLEGTLYGTIGEGLEFGFNVFGSRYFELYTSDLDSSFVQPEIQHWHDFLAALPGPSGGNTTPTLAAISDQTSAGGVLNVTLTIGDVETPAGSLIVGATSSNATLVPTANIVPSGSGAGRTLTITPAPGQTGTATITSSVTDGGGLTTSRTFTLTVTGSNTVPTMSALADVSVVQSGTTDPISFTIGDAETSVANLAVSAASSNTPLVPAANVFLNGTTAARFVCVTPQPNLTGSATITLTVTDSGGLTANRSFMLTVRAPAPAPLVPEIATTRNADGSVRLDWNAETGCWYQVEYSTDLDTWRAAGAATNAGASVASWTDDGTATGAHPAGAAKRFYRLRPLGIFSVTYNGSNFTYTDADRKITGVWFKPGGTGVFPAAIISHGQGGTAASYSASKANEFLPWGLGSVAPNYAHQANGDTSPVMSGFSPENLARGIACRNILATLPWVDQNRVVLWGHSKGAWLSIGLAGLIADRIVAAGNSAGGVLDDSAGTNQAAPTVTQASTVRAPWIMFHGDADTTVPPAESLLFQQTLTSLGVPNARHLYPTNLHNLHQDTSINADMLTKYHAWLQTYGVLP